MLCLDTSALVELKDGPMDDAFTSQPALEHPQTDVRKIHQRRHDSSFSALTALLLICYPPRDLRPCVPG